jgi:hypothetical protein
MTFKEFIKLSEEQSGTDKGLMGYPTASSIRKPSDGQPFKEKLTSIAGQTPRGNSGGMGAGSSPLMMRKHMKK